MNIKDFYMKHYLKLFAIPMLLLLAGAFVVYNTYSKTGDIFLKDVSLQGGVAATLYTGQQFDDLEISLEKKLSTSDITVRELSEFGTDRQTGILIEATVIDDEQLMKAVSEVTGLELNDQNYSSEQTGAALGQAFYKQMIVAMLLAFLFMAVVVFIAFRTLVPSLAVIFSAFLDIFMTIAVMDFFGLKLSTAGIAALLMLIGYSVDTDILLTTKALKRKEEGGLFERMYAGMKTGLTMTFTTIAAVTVGYFVSSSMVIKEMFLIIIIGLIFDIIGTYLNNAGLLMIYMRNRQ